MNSKPSKSMECDLRIVLLGKTGVGKSASGNTILGENRFTEDLSSASKTMKCKASTTEFEGNTLAVTDTPGLFNTNKEREALMKAIVKTTMETQPGPHVLLLVISLASYSGEDTKVLETFKKVFTDAKPYTIVLFTHKDKRDAEELIKRNESLEEFINQSCAKHYVVNNKARDDAQRTSLLKMISEVVEENGERYYTNKMFEEAEKALIEMQKVNPVPDAEKIMVGFESLITKGKEVLMENDPGLFKVLEKFLHFVEDVALKCMPDEASIKNKKK